MNAGGPMFDVCLFAFVVMVTAGYLWFRVDAFYRAIDRTLLEWTHRLFPTLRRRIALSHVRSRIARRLPEQAVSIARQHTLERECAAAAAKMTGPLEGGRYARQLGLAPEAEKYFTEAFELARVRGDEASAVSIAVEGGLHHRAATYYESVGGGPALHHAGEHFEKAGEPVDAARCFEAAGEPYRAFIALSRAGLRQQVESLFARTNDFTTRREAKAWLGAANTTGGAGPEGLR